MAVTNLHAQQGAEQPGRKTETLTQGVINWRMDGAAGPTPFGGSSGADAASGILARAYALTTCLSAAYHTADLLPADEPGEINCVSDLLKGLALEGVGDLIMLAKLLVDEA